MRPVKIKLKELHAFEQGMKDGALVCLLEEEDNGYRWNRYTKEFERKAYQLGFDISKSGKYEETYRTGRHLGREAIKNNDMIPEGWMYYRNSYGIVSAEEV